MKFKEYSFLELLSTIVDNRGKTVPTAETGIPLIATNCIKNETLYPSYDKVRYVSQDTYDTWFRGHPQPGDMIFTCKGSPGRVCWVPDPIDFCIAQDMVGIRANTDVIYPKYLFALLRSSETQSKILNMHVGTLIPHFKKGDFGNLYFDVPVDMEYQKKVGDAYFDFCLKIEANRQTNQTLEHIAQAIFKSWFVDFEPTRAKAQVRASVAQGRMPQSDGSFGGEGSLPAGFTQEDEDLLVERAAMAAISGKPLEALESLQQTSPEQYEQLKTTAALFPDALVDSELGEIPEGWEVKTFGDVSECFDSKRVPLSKKKREEKKPGDIPYYGATSIMDYVNEWIFDDIYLLLGEDGSVIKEDGTPFVQYIWGKAWVNNHAHVLQGINGVSTEQLMLFIQSQNIAAYITGAVQLKLNQGNMNSIPFIDAGEGINYAFFELIKSSYEKIRVTVEESMTLTELRDVLLPKLLSGEIEIGEDI